MAGKLLRRLAGEERGAVSIEFAFVASVFSFMALGIADLGNTLHRKYELEQATYRALERVTMGTLQTDYSDLKTEIAGVLSIPESNVSVSLWLECDGVRKDAEPLTCTSGQQTARFLSISSFANHSPMFRYGPLGKVMGVGDDGTVRLSAESTMRVQ